MYMMTQRKWVRPPSFFTLITLRNSIQHFVTMTSLPIGVRWIFFLLFIGFYDCIGTEHRLYWSLQFVFVVVIIPYVWSSHVPSVHKRVVGSRVCYKPLQWHNVQHNYYSPLNYFLLSPIFVVHTNFDHFLFFCFRCYK